MKLRLHQFLSKTGVFASKADAKQAIWNGEITVNGSVVKKIDFQFNVNTKEVHYCGKVLELHDEDVHFLLYKPAGCICSRLNSHEQSLGKQSVYELFRDHVDGPTYERLITVGRLDEQTTGFLLVTTDGKMVHRITSPDHTVNKTYHVETQSAITEAQMESIRNGVRIIIEDGEASEDYWTKPAGVECLTPQVAILSIGEGKKRQIRRMFGALGNPVVHLHRTSIENMELDAYGLEPGQFVAVARSDVVKLIYQPSI